MCRHYLYQSFLYLWKQKWIQFLIFFLALNIV